MSNISMVKNYKQYYNPSLPTSLKVGVFTILTLLHAREMLTTTQHGTATHLKTIAPSLIAPFII